MNFFGSAGPPLVAPGFEQSRAVKAAWSAASLAAAWIGGCSAAVRAFEAAGLGDADGVGLAEPAAGSRPPVTAAPFPELLAEADGVGDAEADAPLLPDADALGLGLALPEADGDADGTG